MNFKRIILQLIYAFLDLFDFEKEKHRLAEEQYQSSDLAVDHYPGKWKEAKRLADKTDLDPDSAEYWMKVRITFLELGGRYKEQVRRQTAQRDLDVRLTPDFARGIQVACYAKTQAGKPLDKTCDRLPLERCGDFSNQVAFGRPAFREQAHELLNAVSRHDPFKKANAGRTEKDQPGSRAV